MFPPVVKRAYDFGRPVIVRTKRTYDANGTSSYSKTGNRTAGFIAILHHVDHVSRV